MAGGRIVGDAGCPFCEAPIKVQITDKNKLYYICRKNDGGCGHQMFCRDADAEKHLARRITKWVDPNERRAYLGSEALPAKARPAPQPEPEPISEDEPEPIDEDSPEPIEEPEPAPAAPPAKRKLPPALKARQFKKGESGKKSGGFLGMFEE